MRLGRKVCYWPSPLRQIACFFLWLSCVLVLLVGAPAGEIGRGLRSAFAFLREDMPHNLRVTTIWCLSVAREQKTEPEEDE